MALPLPFARSYWADEGRVLAGFYPGAENADEADAKLGGLVDAGIGTIINLMEPDEVGWGGKPFTPYQERVVELGKAQGIEVACLRIPIRDVYIPTPEVMESILHALDEGLAKGQPVYVHCWGGKGRTGTVVGCYLIQHGLATPDNFVEVIRTLRGPDAKTGASPETPKQIQFVRDFCAR